MTASPIGRRGANSRPGVHYPVGARSAMKSLGVSPNVLPWKSPEGVSSMTFEVGETVVYPHHGAAKIEAIETRIIKGVERIYLVLKVQQGDLTVRVPADNAEIVGVRDVVGQEGLDRVAEVVRDLWRREKDRGLSAGEKRMLAKARQILVSELALAEGTNEDKAELVLDEVLAEAVA